MLHGVDRCRVWMIACCVVCACGPTVVVADTDTGSGGGDDTFGSTSVGTSIGTTAGTSVGTSVGTTPDPSAGSDDTTTGGSSSTTTGDPFECGCPDDVVIDFQTPLERGFTPADALAVFDGLVFPAFAWVAYEGAPETVLHVEVTYQGGMVLQGPGGDDGCAFLTVPCDDGILMDVVVHITSDDGWLDWTLDGRIDGVPGENFHLWTPQPVAAATNVGTLAEHQAFSSGEPVSFDGLVVDVAPYYPRGTIWLNLIGVDDDVGYIDLGAATAQ